jgi:ATP-dependent DNA ligase
MQQTTEHAVARARAKHPAFCYIFDCMYLDGRPIVNEPLTRRRAWLSDVVKPESSYRFSEAVEDGGQLFEAAADMGLEGVMAKEKESTYQPGRRSPQWLKIKTRHSTECVIIGYTKGKGDRATSFGALHIALKESGRLRYVGKAGTGFDDRLLKSVLGEVGKLKRIKRPIDEKPVDDAQTIWVEPVLYCEIQYASLTKDGMLREPVFIRMRPDLA